MVKRTGVLILMGLMWFVGQTTSAGAQTVATLGADTIVLGDQTVLTYSGGELLPPQDVLVLGMQTDSTSGMKQATVTCFEPGEYWLKVGTDSLPLVVLDVEVDTSTAEIRDIAPIERVPYTFWEIFRWVLLVLALAAIGVGIWWFLTHRRQVQQALGLAAPVDNRDPHQRAVDNLEELREKRLWQAGKVKEYHTELTDIVRRFIEESTDVRATDMTSDETLEEMEGRKWRVENGLLRDIFSTADMVKFAKSEPLPHEHEASLAKALAYVEQLWDCVKPQEEEVTHE